MESAYYSVLRATDLDCNLALDAGSENRSMKFQMLFHKTGYKKVAVIVALALIIYQRVADLVAGFDQQGRAQLGFQKLICRTLVYQHRHRLSHRLYQRNGIVFFPLWL